MADRGTGETSKAIEVKSDMKDGAQWPSSWLVPDWPVPANVHAICTSRDGGVSQAPWGSLNLGNHVGDVAEHVQQNRERLAQQIQAQTPGACSAFLQQVHGVDVLALDASNVQQSDGAAFDACVTQDAGVVCTIMVADCLPVLLAHRSGLVVGAAHAGWRGLAGMPPGRANEAGPLSQGVLESLFESFCAQAQVVKAQFAMKTEAIEVTTSPIAAQIAAETLAWLGPCIGPSAFEVGAEVHAVFVAHDAQAAACFEAVPSEDGASAPRKYLANLPQLARLRLKALGVEAIYGNDGSDAWCTVTQSSRFFSHRRDAASLGNSGRFAACIWRDNVGTGINR